MSRRFIILVLGGLAALLAVLEIVDGLDPFNDAAFEPWIWERDVSSRLPMAADVVEVATRGGMTRDVMIQLLGPPDREYGGQAVDNGGNALRGARSLVYWLGSSNLASLYGMDDAFVYIHLNDDDSVHSEEIAGY
jgi:hypothetical protein